MTKGLSIDPNTHDSGLVLWDGDQAVHSMTFSSAKGEGRVMSMAWMLYDEVRYKPGLAWAAIEGIYLGQNARVHGELARILGCVELAARQRGIRYYELSTLEIDRACDVRYRKGKRKEALAKFALMNGFTSEVEHEIDAFAVGFVIATQERRRELIAEAERKAS